MGYYLGIDLGLEYVSRRVYDTKLSISKDEFEQMVESKTLPKKYCISAVEVIKKVYGDVDLTHAKISIRSDDDEQTSPFYLDKTQLDPEDT